MRHTNWLTVVIFIASLLLPNAIHAQVHKWVIATNGSFGNFACEEDRDYPDGRDMTADRCISSVKRAKLLVRENPRNGGTLLNVQIVPYADVGDPLFFKLVYPSDLMINAVKEVNIGGPNINQNNGYSRVLQLAGNELASDIFGKALFAFNLWWDPLLAGDPTALEIFSAETAGVSPKPILNRQLYPYHTYTVPTFAKETTAAAFVYQFSSRLSVTEFVDMVNARGMSLYYAGESDELLIEDVQIVRQEPLPEQEESLVFQLNGYNITVEGQTEGVVLSNGQIPGFAGLEGVYIPPNSFVCVSIDGERQYFEMTYAHLNNAIIESTRMDAEDCAESLIANDDWYVQPLGASGSFSQSLVGPGVDLYTRFALLQTGGGSGLLLQEVHTAPQSN